MTDKELAAAKRQARKYLARPAEPDGACERCHGSGQVVEGMGRTGPESMGAGHAIYAPCPICGGTGR